MSSQDQKPQSIKEIEKAIDKALSQKLTSAEKGKIYTESLMAYLAIKNEVDKAYLESLESGMRSLSELMSEEKKEGDEIEKNVIRQKLQEIDDMD
ncbi:MAG: hypothetical protein FGM57_03225 [Candidatus Taylorbacteria bacterium]|nr:hypothetical protein [Candidatus Taylorbacteria bacterium]